MLERSTGIEVVGTAPWGTHFCQFYRTKGDLLDILLPYFEAGLRQNEFCMWVTCAPLTCEDAAAALAARCPEGKDWIESGAIEIVPHDRWYVLDGAFDMDRVLGGWVDKLQGARRRGFDGLRLTGNTFWLEQADWGTFADYEAAVNAVIGQYQMLALCTYSLERCGASEIMDVIKNHEFALMKRHGQWEIVESLQRRTAVESLRRSEERFRALFEHSLNGLALHEIVTDEGGRAIDYVFLQVNRAFEELTGLRADQVIGRRVTEVLPGIEQTPFISIYGQVALTGRATHFEEFSPQIGRHYEITAFSPAPRQFAVTFMDVTDRKAAETALREQATALADANRLKDEFLTTLSHELRTPLNAMLGWASLLRTERLDAATARRGLETIERNARAQKTLIEEILDVSRLISGKMRLDLQPVALAPFLRDVVCVWQPEADNRGVELQLDAVGDLTVQLDRDKCQRVFDNLLKNALEAVHRGPGEVRVEVTLLVGEQVRIAIADTGPGVPEGLDVFALFESTKPEGTGLGLPICKQIVAAHGGGLGFAGINPHGTVFNVDLPIGGPPVATAR